MESNKSAVGDLQGGLYLPPSWQALRQQIAYLAQFGGSLQVVQGRLGAGKTTLLTWLQDEPICGDFIVVGAECGQDVGAFLYDLLWQLGLRPEQGAPLGEHIASLRGYVQSLYQEGERVVVAVDDAHWISEAALAAIVSVLQGGGSTGLGLHLILFSEPGLPEKLDRLQLLDVELHDAAIPALSQSEVEQFLYARGMALVSGLKPETARQIWYRSKGIPGAILKEFEGIGEEPSNAPEPRDDSVNWWSLPLGHLAAVVILVVVLLWAYFGRNSSETHRNDSFNESAPKITSDISSTTTTATSHLPTTPSKIYVDETAEELSSRSAVLQAEKSLTVHSAERAKASAATLENKPISTTPKTSAAEASKANQLGAEFEAESDIETEQNNAAGERIDGAENQATQAKQATTADKSEARVNASQVNLGGQTHKSHSITDMSSLPQAAQVTDSERQSEDLVNASQSAKSSPGIETQRTKSQGAERGGAVDSLRYQYAEQMLNTMPASGFVLQLMALSDYNKLQAFARGQPNSKSLMIYRAQRSGKLLYILVEGFYADKESATAAVVNLPSSQRKGKPWPKQISAIKRDIAEIR